MATISAESMYIVCSHSGYDGLSGDTENLYTDREEAERDAVKRSAHVFAGMSIKYYVLDLFDYIMQVRDEARQDGRSESRDY
jgi:hypothetical protein